MNNSIYLHFISLNKTYNNHYLKRYLKLAVYFKERNLKKVKDVLHHEHHIIPKSFGGLDTNENLVFITPREHFILHHLLYKSFPKSSMSITFFAMCNNWGQMDFRVTSKVYEILTIESSKRNSHYNLKRIAEGTHPFQDKEKARERENKKVAEGRHPWQGDGELQRKNNLKRVEEGTNPFCGNTLSRKRLEEGTHPSQIKKVCPHCKQEFSLGNFAQFHGDKCKLNPLYKREEKKYKPKIECEHCKKIVNGGNYAQHHGDKCKLNPLFNNESKPKIECPHCNRYFSKGKFTQHHGNNCKLKPNN